MNRPRSWSERIARRYALQLDEVLVAWFDSEAWRFTGKHEFCRPVSAEVLLEAAPEAIWPGLMPPDCLPLLGNGRGDWLCLRIDPPNRGGEVVHWYHGGGDWIPWGANLAEAIFFDAARNRLPGRRQVHALAAEPTPSGDPDDQLLGWALRQLPGETNALLPSGDAHTDVDSWLRIGVANVALRCELVLEALDNGLRRQMTPELADKLDVPWEPDIVRWLFDSDQLTADQRNMLQRQFATATDLNQNWQCAALHCTAICDQREDLAWAWDIAGWIHERHGRVGPAVQCYRRGALASAFADQSIRFRTHWFPPAAGKFSIWRLLELSSTSIEQALATSDAPLGAYLARLEQATASSLRKVASSFWREHAAAAAARGHADAAYRALFRAGWDLGLDNMADYRELLARLAEAARAADQPARAALAETHHNAFLRRFG